MRQISCVAAATAAALSLVVSALPASARLLIDIDKSTQTMTVSRDGDVLHRWPVSTGVLRYATPSGNFTPFRMEKDHFSREWDDAPMPHSIFFTKVGHAIHGTEHLRAIGRPASHGCVRLEPKNARVLFDMVKREGMANTSVVLHGDTPRPNAAPAVARRDYEQQRPRYQPGYISPGEADRGERYYDRRAAARDNGRAGYWLEYPDGTRVFVDSERDAPPPPFPFFFGGPLR